MHAAATALLQQPCVAILYNSLVATHLLATELAPLLLIPQARERCIPLPVLPHESTHGEGGVRALPRSHHPRKERHSKRNKGEKYKGEITSAPEPETRVGGSKERGRRDAGSAAPTS